MNIRSSERWINHYFQWHSFTFLHAALVSRLANDSSFFNVATVLFQLLLFNWISGARKWCCETRLDNEWISKFTNNQANENRSSFYLCSKLTSEALIAFDGSRDWRNLKASFAPVKKYEVEVQEKIGGSYSEETLWNYSRICHFAVKVLTNYRELFNPNTSIIESESTFYFKSDFPSNGFSWPVSSMGIDQFLSSGISNWRSFHDKFFSALLGIEHVKEYIFVLRLWLTYIRERWTSKTIVRTAWSMATQFINVTSEILTQNKWDLFRHFPAVIMAPTITLINALIRDNGRRKFVQIKTRISTEHLFARKGAVSSICATSITFG